MEACPFDDADGDCGGAYLLDVQVGAACPSARQPMSAPATACFITSAFICVNVCTGHELTL